jgi:hypothetical protein
VGWVEIIDISEVGEDGNICKRLKRTVRLIFWRG